MRLPFAPRPHAGEALSSWIARLAAHNFVDTDTFWAWVTDEQADDLKPSAATIQSLSDVSGVRRDDIEKMARPLRRAPRSHLLQLSSGTGLRGGACATCLAKADASGRDHGLPTLAASIWTVTCPHHGERLFDLRSFNWQLDGGRLRLSHGTDRNTGARPRSSQYASKLLRVCEAAFTRALLGLPVGSAWRTRKPREFLACVEALTAPVFWRAGAGGPSLARYFDEVAGYGRLSFYVNERADDGVLADLAGEDVRTRASAVTAIGYLLLTSDALATLARSEPLAVKPHPDAFGALVNHFNPGQQARLVDRARDWPDCIARPLRAAIGDLGSSRSQSHLFRATAGIVARPDRSRRRVSAPVSSIALH